MLCLFVAFNWNKLCYSITGAWLSLKNDYASMLVGPKLKKNEIDNTNCTLFCINIIIVDLLKQKHIKMNCMLLSYF